jgi:hypothetical protein
LLLRCSQFYERELRKLEKLPMELARQFEGTVRKMSEILREHLGGVLPLDNLEMLSPAEQARVDQAEGRGPWAKKPVSTFDTAGFRIDSHICCCPEAAIVAASAIFKDCIDNHVQSKPLCGAVLQRLVSHWISFSLLPKTCHAQCSLGLLTEQLSCVVFARFIAQCTAFVHKSMKIADATAVSVVRQQPR